MTQNGTSANLEWDQQVDWPPLGLTDELEEEMADENVELVYMYKIRKLFSEIVSKGFDECCGFSCSRLVGLAEEWYLDI